MYKLSMVQVVSMTSSSFIPLLLWVFPRYAAYLAGVDGQWAILGVCLLGLLSGWIHGLLNRRFPKWTLAETPSMIFGNIVGKALSLAYIPGYVLFLAVSLSSYAVAMQSYLPNTPRLATIIALALVAVMGAQYGLETLARVASIIFPVTLLTMFVAYGFLYFQGNWTGVFTRVVSLSNTAKTAGDLLPMFIGLNIYMMMSPYYDHRKQNTIWLPLFAVGISSVTVITVYLTSIRVVGYEGLRVLTHPIEFVLALVQIHGLFIQRFGIILVFILTMFETVFFANHLWGLSEFLGRLLRLTPSAKGWSILGYVVVTITVFQLIPNQQVWDFLILKVMVPLSWLYLVVEPGILLLFSYLLRKGEGPAQN